MHSRTHFVIGFAAAAVAAIAAAATANTGEADAAGQALVISTPSLMDWKPGTNGSEQALLWGDRDHANGTISRYPARFELRPHFHTHDMRGVIVSGTWVMGIVGGTTAMLPAGSYFFLPGKTAHTDRCAGPEPCVMLLGQDESRDLVYLDAEPRQ
jgi:hypothetical protein